MLRLKSIRAADHGTATLWRARMGGVETRALRLV